MTRLQSTPILSVSLFLHCVSSPVCTCVHIKIQRRDITSLFELNLLKKKKLKFFKSSLLQTNKVSVFLALILIMMASPCQNCTFQHKLCETLMTLVQALDVRYFFSRLQEMLLPSCFFKSFPPPLIFFSFVV